MNFRNKNESSRRAAQAARRSNRRRRRAARRGRRGVLLLVVLSMLVLFMLIGTAFLMSSNQSRSAAKSAGKLNRVGTFPTKLLDRALLQIVRDTENPYSVIRHHSLLADMYGTAGFEAKTYAPQTVNLNPNVPEGQATRFAGVTAATAAAAPLGPTQGQLIDIYVRQLPFNVNDPLTLENETTTLTQADARHVVKLERSALGQPQVHMLPLTKGYYNGCLLTMTSGPAAGATTRILDYEYVADIAPNTPTQTRLFRFRVMTFPRADGYPLQVDTTAARRSEITDIAGQTFLVNGRAFSGTGAGYNPLAQVGAPRLTALQLMRFAGSDYDIGAEIALTPNSVYLDLAAIGAPAATAPLVFDPFAAGLSASAFEPLNDFVNGPVHYASFSGLGGMNESYDAADFQNMFLALQSVTPRARGRVVHGGEVYLSPDEPAALSTNRFLRFDLEDVPMPSFHRPDLVNFWYHRMAALLASSGMDPENAVRAVLQPYDPVTLAPLHGLRPEQAALIASIKRKVLLRPSRDDHPNFDGGNPQSRNEYLAGASGLYRNGNIAVPYWEIMGPWDVDNDNDGIPDSVWVDLGDPVTQAEDGTLYKPLYAFLVVDLDSRLNANVHSLADHVLPPLSDPQRYRHLDPTFGNPGNLAHNVATGGLSSSLYLARGTGYGPAEISLRPIFPAPLGSRAGNRVETTAGTEVDSLAALLAGRLRLGGDHVTGRQGLDLTPATDYQTFAFDAAPGITSAMTNQPVGPPGIHAQFKFIGYPSLVSNYRLNTFFPSAFGTAPDLHGRYAIGIDYTGQPVYEYRHEDPTRERPLVADSPYEINHSSQRRRAPRADGRLLTLQLAGDGSVIATQYIEQGASGLDIQSVPGQVEDSDDAPFATADLERVLRAYDADAGTLPSRLWDVVDAFDPLKLMLFDSPRVTDVALKAFGAAGEPERLASAQQMAAINRRLVTTEQFDLPVSSGTIPSWVRATPNGEQDFFLLTGNTVGEATLVDLIGYRMQRELVKKGVPPFNTTDPAQRAQYEQMLGALAEQLLAPEVVAGLRMDVNRPFGDGLDSNNSGIVDDPFEAGDPFLDLRGNGKFIPRNPFIDVDGSGGYTQPSDRLWNNSNMTFDHTNGHGEPLHPEMAAAVNNMPGGPFPNARVRNLESQARQLYARHLYCLMLGLMDENYVAPWEVIYVPGANAPQNEEVIEPQLHAWMETMRTELVSAGASAAEADFLVKRKLTCRMVAQWAINCVDMRDADAIMTPFEYDENPWDGWGCLDANGVNIPLDGDPATDENQGEVIDWPQVLSNNLKAVTTLRNPPVPVNQTRGVVWGAERPELLITETLAFHDRRTEDLTSNNTTGHRSMNDSQRPDPHPDQRLRPRGSLFVEVYNPWSSEGHLPAELYRDAAGQPGVRGVDLSRLSNLPGPNNKFSPVWRLIVVNEDPEYRNADPDDRGGADTQVQQQGQNSSQPNYSDAAEAVKNWKAADPLLPPFRPSDVDFDGMFDADFVPRRAATSTRFEVAYPFIEREFYFTTDNSPPITYPDRRPPVHDVSAANFKLHIPQRHIEFNFGADFYKEQTQRFISAALESAGAPPAIAPILPGRYGVIGTAGVKYNQASLANSYTTTIGRINLGMTNTGDSLHQPHRTRRIELRPDPNPNQQQIRVEDNGGNPPANGRDNEQLSTGAAAASNVYTANSFQPAVAIPVEGMSISEPPWGWVPIERQLAEQEFGSARGGPPFLAPDPRPEGSYMSAQGNETSFDIPFDVAQGDLALQKTGTTPNYRTVHLQRLANPMLAWNPPAGQDDHDPTRPVNPYRTVDTSSVDLTAFNGVSSAEGQHDTVTKRNLGKYPPFGGTDRAGMLANSSKQHWYFRSLERGAFAHLSLIRPVPMVPSLPLRALWAQEPVIGSVKDLNQANSQQYRMIRDGRDTTMQASEVPPHIRSAGPGQGAAHHLDMVLEHTLGFANESFGDLYDRNNAPTAAAIGAPRHSRFTDSAGNPVLDEEGDPVMIESTYPWLAWNNRPFVSAAELLQVPAASAAQMLRQFNPIDVDIDVEDYPQANPYDGSGVANGMTEPNWKRLKQHRAPFGHLANFSASHSFSLAVTDPRTVAPADVVRDGTGAPIVDANGHVQAYGAPHFYRLLDYVQVPSRFVGTDTLLSPEIFNDPNGASITGPDDPRYRLQPPFNKVSRQRDPGKVNLNTVLGRRMPPNANSPAPILWSEVFDGIMHRARDAHAAPQQLGHFGPAWRDVVISRKGYAQFNADGSGPIEKLGDGIPPDAFAFGLNRFFPTVFANPFRASDAGDLVPLAHMVHAGVHATWLRSHHLDGGPTSYWGGPGDDNNDGLVNDAREAGFGSDTLYGELPTGRLTTGASRVALFSEAITNPAVDAHRNPAMMYQPLTRLGNLVTTRSNAYAIWITVGYFEVEPAPDWNHSDQAVRQRIRARFGATLNDGDVETIAGRALYNRVYPEGYALAQEVGSDTGNTRRHRGFYIVDRSEPVGFKPGEDLNVEQMIRLRRRIE